MNDISSFNVSIIFVRETISYFKDESKILKKIYGKDKHLATKKESFERYVKIDKTPASVTMFVTGIRLLPIPLSIDLSCGVKKHMN